MIISPAKLSGSVRAQPSKSMVHRLAICAALAHGESRIFPVALSDDISATLGALKTLFSAEITLSGETLTVSGGKRGVSADILADCRESGSTLRFLIPPALALNGGAVFSGAGRLFERPLGPYMEALRDARFEMREGKLVVSGTLKPGEYAIPGGVSSQFVSGLLFALPLLDGDSGIRISGRLESRGYVDMTMKALRVFGVRAEFASENRILVPGGQRYVCTDAVSEGDYSHAAFFLVAGALGGDVSVTGLRLDSLQGDRRIIDILREMGADISFENGTARARGGELRAVDIDAADIPDLVPALAVAACGAGGETRIFNASRLRLKESDRLQAVSQELAKLGADIRETADGLVILGGKRLAGGSCSSRGDHRIAMALAVAAALADGDILLEGSGAVSKSAPQFWKEYGSLGGKAI